MIIEFSLNGFASYCDIGVLSTLSTEEMMHPDHVVTRCDNKLLRTIAIFGNNNSGKTNLITAVDSMRGIMTGDLTPFNLLKYVNRYVGNPLSFSITFCYRFKKIKVDLVVKPDIDAIVSEKIKVECADESNIEMKREMDKSITVIRNGSDSVVVHPINRSMTFISLFGKDDMLKDDNLSELSSEDKEAFSDVYRWFRNNLLVFKPDRFTGFDIDCEKTAKILKHFDTGVERIKDIDVTGTIIDFDAYYDKYLSRRGYSREYYVENEVSETREILYDGKIICIKMDKGRFKSTLFELYHEGCDLPFELSDESNGLLKLIEYSQLLYKGDDDITIIIDEIDRSFHPNVARELISLFLSKKNKNQQLIFTTHESSLMDSELLRLDEVRFVKKDDEKKSHIYSLSDTPDEFFFLSKEDFLKGKYDMNNFNRSLS